MWNIPLIAMLPVCMVWQLEILTMMGTWIFTLPSDTIIRVPGITAVWLSDGKPEPDFTEQVLAITGSDFSKTGDVDQDGDLDIFGANWSGSVDRACGHFTVEESSIITRLKEGSEYAFADVQHE